MLYGPTGTGKTAAIHALAKERGYDLIETNASDFRSAEDLQHTVGGSVRERSLFKRGKIFMLDEIDALSGAEDRGAASEIAKIIKSSQHPIVLAATNAYDRRLRTLRPYCVLVRFGKVDGAAVRSMLEKVCRAEAISADAGTIGEIARRADGDMRAALNDLETLAAGKSGKRISADDLRVLHSRNRKTDVFNGLDRIFGAGTIAEARRALDEVDVDPDTLMWWIENNITRVYDRPEEIAAAFDALSVADVFKQRIASRQDWRFFAYYVDMLTGGVAVAGRARKSFVKYQYPSVIAILGRTKIVRREERERLMELSRRLHCSTKKVRSEFLAYLKIAKIMNIVKAAGKTAG
jgi:replication factor C large subunit